MCHSENVQNYSVMRVSGTEWAWECGVSAHGQYGRISSVSHSSFAIAFNEKKE